MNDPTRSSGGSLRALSPTLREWFEAALTLPAAERAAYLRERCQDPADFALLQRLLEADASEGDPWTRAAAEQLAEATSDADADMDAKHAYVAGTRIGAWELIELLGEGGSSSVFLAHRDLDGVRQLAAVKLLRRGLQSPGTRRLFRRERQALSALSHPNIAHLIDGGVTEAGTPYLVMEHVDGVTVTRHAAERQLDLRDRLRLIVVVCRAVAAAHRNLIVHRDLKPSNILVSADGTVKLLDFGIAKLLDDDLAEATASGYSPLTPGYAAPEQFVGGPISTATDVYALGVLLHELVHGERPASQRTPNQDAASRPRPQQAAPAAARKALRGDLANLIAKAMAEEPERRYAAAADLADDLERFLAGQPLRAHPPSNAYRLRKFVARHRGAVAVTLVLVVGVLASLAVALWQRDRARHQAGRAEAMRDFMVSAFKEAEPTSPRESAPRITDVVEQAIVSARVDTAMDAAVRTELLAQLGGVLLAQGATDRAREVLQWNYDRALDSPGAHDRAAVEAGDELVIALITDGDYVRARSLLDTLFVRAAGGDAKLVAGLYRDSALLASKQSQAQRSLADAAESVRLARVSGDAQILDSALDNHANAWLSAGDMNAAIGVWETLLLERSRRYGGEHTSVAAVHSSLSRAYRRVNRPGDAERHIRAALAIDEGVLAKDDWRRANHLNALMMIQLRNRDFPAALASANESLRINRRAFGGDDHPAVTNDLNSVGMAHAALEQWPQALTPLRISLQNTIAKFGAHHFETALAYKNHGFALAQSGDAHGGETQLRRAIAILQQLSEPQPHWEARAWEDLARTQLDRGDANGARAAIDAIERLLAGVDEPDAYWDGRLATLRATQYLAGGDAAGALDQLQAAGDALGKSNNADAVLRAEVPLLQAAVARRAGQVERADELARIAQSAFAVLPNPPERLQRLAESLPVADAASTH